MTLNEIIEIAYRSSAVACAAAQTKLDIVLPLQYATRLERNGFSPDTPERQDAQKRLVLLQNYKAAVGYAVRFYTYEGVGVKTRLEALYTGSSLIAWDTIATADLKTTQSFVSTPGGPQLQRFLDRIETAQTNFTGNSSDIPTTDFPTQFEEMFDLFINDIWASEGMRIWCDDELDRAGESAGALAGWDAIQADAGVFFADAKRCCVRLANNFAQYELGGPNEAAYINKYTHGPSNRYKAKYGLWALDPNDLAPNDRGRIENKNVTWR